MNLDYAEAKALLHEIITHKDQFGADVEVIICPPTPYLSAFSDLLKSNSWISLGSQNNFS